MVTANFIRDTKKPVECTFDFQKISFEKRSTEDRTTLLERKISLLTSGRLKNPFTDDR